MPEFIRRLRALKPFYDGLYRVMLLLCKLLLVADIFITSWSVVGRYVSFIDDPHWSEEMVLTFMVYMAVLSATLAIRKRTHIRMTAFDKYLPKKAVVGLDLLADLAVLALGVILLVEGAKVISPSGNIAKFAKYSSLPNLSQVWMYLPVAVAGAGMILFELEQVVLRIGEFYDPDDAEKEVQP